MARRKESPSWAANRDSFMRHVLGKSAMRKFDVAEAYWFRDLGAKEIAEEMHMKLSTVEKIIYRLTKHDKVSTGQIDSSRNTSTSRSVKSKDKFKAKKKSGKLLSLDKTSQEYWNRKLASEGLDLQQGLDSQLIYVEDAVRLKEFIDNQTYGLGCGGGRRVHRKHYSQ